MIKRARRDFERTNVLNQGAGGVRVAHPLFQVEGSGSSPTSALDLRFERVPFQLAKDLNRRWHSKLPLFETGFISNMPFLSFSADFEDVIYAVAIWSNPVARLLPQTWLELRRFAIAPDAPSNTASRMLGFMARNIKKTHPVVTTLISYQDCSAHLGTIYKAAGWLPSSSHPGGSWNRPHSKNSNGTPRTRPDANKATGRKIRWERKIR